MATVTDSRQRIENLMGEWERTLRRTFLEAVSEINSPELLSEIEMLLQEGRQGEAVDLVVDNGNGIATLLAAAAAAAYLASGIDAGSFISDVLPRGEFAAFNPSSQRVTNYLRQDSLELIAEFDEQQRIAARSALIQGIESGEGSAAIARRMRDSIGLTARQQQAVDNYRRLLEEGSRQALDRSLRDRRFDSSVRQAAAGKRQLTADQIDRMVDRYRQRYLQYRAETIARTETLRAVNAATDEMYQQAFDSGVIFPDWVLSTWRTRRDDRVRDSHADMEGQQRPEGEPFISGKGNSLRYPGDPNAPVDEVANCRCVLERAINFPGPV